MPRDDHLFHRLRADGVGGDVVVAQSDHERRARKIGGEQLAELSGQQRDERGEALGGQKPAFPHVDVDVGARLFLRQPFALAFADVHGRYAEAVDGFLLGADAVLPSGLCVDFVRLEGEIGSDFIHVLCAPFALSGIAVKFCSVLVYILPDNEKNITFFDLPLAKREKVW